MLQGVRDVFEIVDLGSADGEESEGQGKLVFIGRGIKDLDFEGSLARALRDVGD